MSLNRTKASLGVLAPLVTALSAWLTASVAKYGVHVDASGVNAALVSGATCGIAVMVKLIHDVEKDDPEIKAVAGDADAISSAIEQADPQIRQVVRHAIEEEILSLTHRIGQSTAVSNGESVPATASRTALPALSTDEAARRQPAEQLPSAEPPPQVEQPPPAEKEPLVEELPPAEPSLLAEELLTAEEHKPTEESQSIEEGPPITGPSPAEQPSRAEEHEEQSAPQGPARSAKIPRLG
jgi:hypothetical protein